MIDVLSRAPRRSGAARTFGGDSAARVGTLTIAPVETTKRITIVVCADRKKPGEETFYLDLFGNRRQSLSTK